VMYLGRIVEIGPAVQVFERPLHPYTKALVSAVPIPDPELEARRQRILLPGDPPSPIKIPVGCPFHPRCPYMLEKCKEVVPPLEPLDTPEQKAACIRLREIPHGGERLQSPVSPG
jgi:oligopeptide/dipeptide ABC transporter ATP-binding protein